MRIRIKSVPQQLGRNARKWKHEDGGNLFVGGGPEDNLYYMSRSAEAATNSMELGRRMGLKPGTPWPGRKKAMELFEKYSTSNDQKTKAFNVLNWKQKPRRVWDALTGRYFILGAGSMSTASLKNN